jgi:hypothetical protein
MIRKIIKPLINNRKCTQPRYCSVECAEAAKPVHLHECGQLDLLHSVGIGHLAVRTILVTGLDRLTSLRTRIKVKKTIKKFDVLAT